MMPLDTALLALVTELVQNKLFAKEAKKCYCTECYRTECRIVQQLRKIPCKQTGSLWNTAACPLARAAH